jgi:hypothetical protein
VQLEEFVDERALESLERPTALAEGLPGAAYGKDFHNLEQQRLFPKVWAADEAHAAGIRTCFSPYREHSVRDFQRIVVATTRSPVS